MIWIFLSAAFYLNSVSCGTEYLLDMAILPPYDTITDVYLGQKLHLEAKATFAEGQTTENVSIEFLSSVGTPSTFAVSDVISVTKGINLNLGSELTTADVQLHKGEDYSDTTLKQRFDTRAVLDIGTVTSTGPGAEEDNQIVVVVEVVYFSIGSYADGDEHKLSAGMAYASEMYIWISQLGVNVKSTSGTENETPTFSVDPVDSDSFDIKVGTPTAVNLSMQIPRSASSLTVEAVVVNDTEVDIFVQEMSLVYVGEAYAFSTVKENIYTIGYTTCPLSALMTLDMGTPINKESKESSPDPTSYLLVVRTVFQVENPGLVGNVYTMGFGVGISGSEVWVGDFHLSVISGTWQSFTSFTTSAVESSISPGFAGGVNLVLTLPRQTNHNYSFDLSTRAVSASANALSILAITPTAHGNNIPCSIPNSAVNVQLTESTVSPGVFDSASWSTNISNTGMQPSENLTNESDDYVFLIAVMMFPTATENETFQLDINVNGVGSQTIQITAGPYKEYPANISYSFFLTNDCPSDKHTVGSTLAFNLRILTERAVTAGKMTIEFPIPSNQTEPYLKFKSARVLSKGSNLVCVPLGTLSAAISDWVNGSGANDRAVVTIPLVCNVNLTNDPLADEFEIEVQATWQEKAPFLDSDTTGQAEFGIGAKIGDRIWVANYGFETMAPINLGTSKRINGVIIPDGPDASSWPGDLKVQWSFDNREFYDYPHTFQPGVVSVGQTTYMLDPPLYAQYARLVSTDQGICMNHSFESTDIGSDIEFRGSDSSNQIMLSKIMLILDGNNDTCMSLPTQSTTNTAKFYWTTVNSQTLGANGSVPFNLTIVGNGLQCNNTKGPQVTKVMHPKDSNTLKFTGNRKKCTFLEETAESPMSCKYICNCTDTVTCADVSLLLYHNGSPADKYEICDLKVDQ